MRGDSFRPRRILSRPGKALGIERKAFLQLVESRTHRRRSTSLAELTNAAVFLASDRASAMTGTTVNLTGGIVVD